MFRVCHVKYFVWGFSFLVLITSNFLIVEFVMMIKEILYSFKQYFKETFVLFIIAQRAFQKY